MQEDTSSESPLPVPQVPKHLPVLFCIHTNQPLALAGPLALASASPLTPHLPGEVGFGFYGLA